MLQIEYASNGWIIKNIDATENKTFSICVVEDNEGEDVEPKIKLLQNIAETLSLYGSRYDKWRIHITKKRGDKWEKPEKGSGNATEQKD